MTPTLLAADEPSPYRTLRADSVGPFLLTVDHASRRIPNALAGLGLGGEELRRHIAWDIGIAGVTEALSDRLAAAAIFQNYSRLVIDCNRQPSQDSAFPVVSENTRIPGNAGLSARARNTRQRVIFDPYHGAIGALIDARQGRGQTTIYIAMHSFTPVFKGLSRALHVGILYAQNRRFARLFGDLLRAEGDLTVADNEPYSVSNDEDYGIPMHAERRGLDYVEVEIRQDLITTARQQRAWADRLARLLPTAAARLDNP